jgi:hypothetical protein
LRFAVLQVLGDLETPRASRRQVVSAYAAFKGIGSPEVIWSANYHVVQADSASCYSQEVAEQFQVVSFLGSESGLFVLLCTNDGRIHSALKMQSSRDDRCDADIPSLDFFQPL